MAAKVLKAPFWFLVIACLIYSVFGVAVTSVTFLLRRMPETRARQARLIGGPKCKRWRRERAERGAGR